MSGPSFDLDAIKAAFQSQPPKILMPVPDAGFDPTEVAVPWKLWSDLGAQITFATEKAGTQAAADPNILKGMCQGMIKIHPEPKAFYEEMIKSQEFLNSIAWDQVDVNAFDALFVPGGHGGGVEQILYNKTVQGLVIDFYKQKKAVGAICHGVIITAESGLFKEYPKLRTSGLPAYLERQAYVLTKMGGWGGYQLASTKNQYTEVVIKKNLSSEKQWERGPLDMVAGMNHGTIKDHKHAFCLQDGHYFSARFPGDAYLIALTMANYIVTKEESSSSSSSSSKSPKVSL